MTLRLAQPDEEEAVRRLVRTCYAHYVPRIGREPMPMTDDYRVRIAAGEAWLLLREADQALIGVLVLVDEPDALLLDNVAIAGEGRGRALAASSSASPSRRRRGAATTGCACSPM